MEEQKLAKLLHDLAFSVNAQENGDPEDERVWLSFLEKLDRELAASGCGARAKEYTGAEPYVQACGYHRDYGYFFITCKDRGEYSITILENEEDMAINRFLEQIIDKRAYEWALEARDREERAWPYLCRFDYRKVWFGKALEWLASVVDWAFFAQCADRYIALLNRWFAVPHWEYDYQFSRITEVSGSKEYSDALYVYRIEYEEPADRSLISLVSLCGPAEGGDHNFFVHGEALDMRRKDGQVWLLMNREKDNVDAYTLDGEFLWNIGEKQQNDHCYADLNEAEHTLLGG